MVINADRIAELRKLCEAAKEGGKVNWHIYCNGKMIACFVHESDCNACIDMMSAAYEDCIFEKREAGK